MYTTNYKSESTDNIDNTYSSNITSISVTNGKIIFDPYVKNLNPTYMMKCYNNNR